jgi:hypothetical protein
MIGNIKKIEIMFTDTKLEVPYFSQYLEVDNKENCLKACGMTCVYMVLKYNHMEIETLDNMVLEGIDTGGFGISGWSHDYFVDLFIKLGFESERKESMRNNDVTMIQENILNGYPVIVSAERILFDKKIFHQVLLTGIRQDDKGNLEGFFYHDPASLQPELATHCYVPIKTFFLSWRKMAIFAKKKQ